jgi:transcriptional regulator with XRE-family HTH domain
MRKAASKKIKVTQASASFTTAVAAALRFYRDGNNPEKANLSDSELARRLGVSKSTLSKYLSGKQFIGGEPLARVFTELGVSLRLGNKEIGARAPSEPPKSGRPLEQICFVFDTPCFVEETPKRIGVSIAAPPGDRPLTVHLKLAS